MIYNIISKLTTPLPPELLHKLLINFLKLGIVEKKKKFNNLQTKLLNKTINNPLGIAAGFDKNAEAVEGCFGLGFGFIEVGTVTPMPQFGNPKPRVFKIPEYNAIIQRLGFNNLGVENLIDNLKKIDVSSKGLIGINIGRNKNSPDLISDYLNLYEIVKNYADYITINISSPNTPNLRDLENKNQIGKLINKLSKLKKKINTFIKLSPEISDENLEYICNVSMNEEFISGIILTNTTISREMLYKKPMNDSWKIKEIGGLSGPPLKNLTNSIIKKAYEICKGKIQIIGVGGISNGKDAFEKISIGANALQLYTSLVYKGPNVVNDILEDLSNKIREKGLENVSDLVGKNISYE
jgi:dihydroorotate dehydrogenase